MYRFPQAVEGEGAKKSSSASFSRTVGRAKPVVYHITERAPKPTSSDWHRVVAVFVTGQTWQFKGWPHKACDHSIIVSLAHQEPSCHGAWSAMQCPCCLQPPLCRHAPTCQCPAPTHLCMQYPGYQSRQLCIGGVSQGQEHKMMTGCGQGAEEGDLALALSCMLGVYVGLKGEDVPANVKKWNLLKARYSGFLRTQVLLCTDKVSEKPKAPNK